MNDQQLARFFSDAKVFADAIYESASGNPKVIAAFLLAQASLLTTQLHKDVSVEAADQFLDVFDEGFDILVGDHLVAAALGNGS